MGLPVLSPLLSRVLPASEAKTILVHGKDQPLGDGFIQAGFFHALRCRFPSAHITFAVSIGGTPYADVLREVMAPFIDETLTDQALCLEREQMHWRAPNPLAGRRFDLVIDFEKVWWRTLAIRRIRHRVFVSASKHFAFSDRWPRSWVKPDRLAHQYLMLLDAIGMTPRADLPPISFRAAAAEDLAQTLLPPGPTYVGLVPGAGNRDKCWPLDRYIALGRRLVERGRVPVLLLGPQEVEWVAPLREQLPEAVLPAWRDGTMLAEFASPLQTVAIGRRLAAAVTNDCGTAHMLAAAATPLVTLFGYTNPVRYAPLTPRLITLSAKSYGDIYPAAIPFAAVEAAMEEMLTAVS